MIAKQNASPSGTLSPAGNRFCAGAPRPEEPLDWFSLDVVERSPLNRLQTDSQRRLRGDFEAFTMFISVFRGVLG